MLLLTHWRNKSSEVLVNIIKKSAAIVSRDRFKSPRWKIFSAHFHPRNNVGQRWKTPSLHKHRKPPWRKQPKQLSPRAESELHQKLQWLSMHDHLFTRWELHHCLWGDMIAVCLLTRFASGEETDRFGTNSVPTPHIPHPLIVSALLGSLMTAERSPHYWEELACSFTTHLPLNAAKQQMSAPFMRQTLPSTRLGLVEQEGNVRGQIKSGVGCLLHGWVTPSGPL